MDFQESKSTPKISQKIKAAGPFRVFLNFLQRPAKKKTDMSPPKNENQLKSVSSFIDARPVHKAAEIDDTPYFKSSSYSGTDCPLKHTSNALTFPDVKALSEGSIKQTKQRVPGAEQALFLPYVQNPSVDDESDDEVFLEDSYFEDDYFEDFSSDSSSKPNELQYGTAAPDFNDSFTFFNNLDKANPEFEKNYDKNFLHLNPDVLNSNRTPKTLIAPRTRRFSLPCELLRAAKDELDDSPALADPLFKTSKLVFLDTPTLVQNHSSPQRGYKTKTINGKACAAKSVPSTTPSKYDSHLPYDSKPEKGRRDLKRSNGTSIESGYGSTRKLSTPSPASSSCSTPMQRLHSGATVLSPHSLNALDGISKPKGTPKRNLRPKFIFPPRPESANLKAVPEVSDSRLADQKQSRLDSDANETYPSIKVAKHYEREIKRKQERTNRTTSEENPTSDIRINLNVSLHGVDINNNVILPNNDHVRQASLLPSTHGECGQSSPLQTPLRRQEAQVGGLNVTTPCGKLLKPICTSSPLHPHHLRKTPIRGTHRNSSLFDSPRKTEPACKTKRLNDVALTKTQRARTDSIRKNSRSKSTSVRRKKIKRSARTRLLFDDSNNEDIDEFESVNRFQSSSTDYLLLKRIAESIIVICPNRQLLDPWLDLPNLMENLNIQYSNLIDGFMIDSSPKLRNLAARLEGSKEIYQHLTSKNCIESILVALLTKDWGLVISSLDFAFENLPEVMKENDSLSFLAPEIVFMLLSNPRRIVKNSHGFPHPYSLAEIEVFKAAVKYVEAIKTKKPSTVTRAKNILSNVADSLVLWDNKSSPKAPRNTIMSAGKWKGHNDVRSNPPRRHHRLLFQRFSPITKATNDYYVSPLISHNVQCLEDLASTFTNPYSIPPVHISSLFHDYFCLRKLYFSHGRYNGLPYITKIGMQYSCKGKKKTFFLAETPTADRKVSSSHPRLPGNSCRQEVSRERSNMYTNPDAIYANLMAPSYEATLVKKTSIVLEAGEHIKALSILGQSAVHNVEIVTNVGRRIRAHGMDAVSDAGWVTIATPSSPYCLHAICGDVQKFANRTYLRDLGAVWMVASVHSA